MELGTINQGVKMKKKIFRILVPVVMWILLLSGSPYMFGDAVNFTKTGSAVTGAEYYDIYIERNIAYCAVSKDGIDIIDISDPANPTKISNCDTPGDARALVVSEGYAYVADSGGGLQIIDVSDQENPAVVGALSTLNWTLDVAVSGNYAYIADGVMKVVDISTPEAPKIVAESIDYGSVHTVHLHGDLAFAMAIDFYLDDIFMIFDISNPLEPDLKGYVYQGDYYDFWYLSSVAVSGDYAYIASGSGFHIVDISSPSNPLPVSMSEDSKEGEIFIGGDYAYIAGKSEGLTVYDISKPKTPVKVGEYKIENGSITDVHLAGHHVYVVDKKGGEFITLTPSAESGTPILFLNRSTLRFNNNGKGVETPPQQIRISNRGGGTMNWTATADKDWIKLTPASGTGEGQIEVQINGDGMEMGTYYGTVTVSAPNTVNTTQTVEIEYTIYRSTGIGLKPFGEFSTPVDDSKVSGSIPVTGWAMDDIGLQGVKIYREDGDPENLVYIGDAVFVEGARPDVELQYSYYPASYKAGWGYMLLTNYLPDEGNGTYVLHAVAIDLEGLQTELGTKTIHVNNKDAVRPYGAIDTPEQGGLATGSKYINFGWALTPQPYTIPFDGKTINVWVDGVNIGNPVYNQYREDIATLFPGHNNSNGAVGYFVLDTTGFDSGVHTIQWTAKDDAGNIDGIGSRFFTIQNTGDVPKMKMFNPLEKRSSYFHHQRLQDLSEIDNMPVRFKKGYNENSEPVTRQPDGKGIVTIEIRELERLELHLTEEDNVKNRSFDGYQKIGERLRKLPAGTFLDRKKGKFYWQPGAGYVGNYRLIFLTTDPLGNPKRQEVNIRILPMH
jgi:hypothetical protein